MVDGLDLEVGLQTVRAELSADTAHLEPTERCVRVKVGVVVDPDGTSVDGPGDSVGLSGVVGEHGGGQTVGRVVGYFDRLLLGGEFGGYNDGSENLQESALLMRSAVSAWERQTARLATRVLSRSDKDARNQHVPLP